MRRRLSSDITRRDLIVGSVFLAVLVIGVYLSYGANKGIPVLPAYEITVAVPDAQELVAADHVRIGGARIGVVKRVEGVPRRGRQPAYARLHLALQPRIAELPVDSTVQVRPGSILGGKYLAIAPGRSRRTMPEGGSLPLRQGLPVTDLDEAFQIFDAETTRGIRGSVSALGDANAGRGSAVNAAVADLAALLPGAERVTTALASPRTRLGRFVGGAADVAGALAPVSSSLASLVDHGATTLAALDAAGPALGEAIDELAPTEVVGTRVLRSLQPLLDDAAVTARALKPSVAVLPAGAARLRATLRDGRVTLRQRTRGALDPLVRAFGRQAADPAARGTIRTLRSTIGHVGPTLEALLPGQTICNVLTLAFRNLSSMTSEGDVGGSWVRLVPVFAAGELFQRATQSPELHLNFYPREDETECEAGNEPYLPGQVIGNPPGRQGR